MFFFFITLLRWLGRRPIGDWLATSRGLVPDRSQTSCIKSQRGPLEVANKSPISREPVPDQSPTSRRPTAKPSCDSSATSATVMNFGSGEVAERLQCMSDLIQRDEQTWLTSVNNKPLPFYVNTIIQKFYFFNILTLSIFSHFRNSQLSFNLLFFLISITPCSEYSTSEDE